MSSNNGIILLQCVMSISRKPVTNYTLIPSYQKKKKNYKLIPSYPKKKKNLLFNQLCVACGISFGPYIFAFTFKINENNVKRYPY